MREVNRREPPVTEMIDNPEPGSPRLTTRLRLLGDHEIS